MAATTEARRLTEAHRLAQTRIGAHLVSQLAAVWPLLDPGDIDGTIERWLSAAIPIVRSGRATSARLAAAYMQTFRALELGLEPGRFTPAIAEEIDTAAVTTSFVLTGPARIRQASALLRPLQPVLRTALRESASAGMRHALNGGRDTVTRTVSEDAKALGWARAASGKACSFCALLAGRGPVFSDSTVDFRAHDHCTCTAEPVYRPDAAWPAGSRKYADLYQQAKDEGGDVRAAFRRLLQAA